MTPMLTFFVDGVETRLPEAIENLGELLDNVDTGLAGCGRIVTAVRLHGVDQPAFRDAQFCSRPLSAVLGLEITSGTPEELALSCLTEAIAGLTAVSLSCPGVAAQFRTSQVAGANLDLATIMNSITSGLAVVAGAAPYVRFAGGHEALDLVVSGTTRHVESLTDAQASRDWLTVADLLEFDLGPALNDWVDVLASATV